MERSEAHALFRPDAGDRTPIPDLGPWFCRPAAEAPPRGPRAPGEVVERPIVYVIGSMIVTYDPQFVALASPAVSILFTVVPAIVAVILYAILLRYSANPPRIFTIIAAVVLILSWIPDITYIPTVPGASVGQTVVLMIMHLVAAVVIVWMLTTLTRNHGQ